MATTRWRKPISFGSVLPDNRLDGVFSDMLSDYRRDRAESKPIQSTLWLWPQPLAIARTTHDAKPAIHAVSAWADRYRSSPCLIWRGDCLTPSPSSNRNAVIIVQRA